MEAWQMPLQPGTDEWREHMSLLQIHALQQKINQLENKRYLVESNEGTWGATEAVRKVGTADPAFANSRLYITLRGHKRREGCARRNAPGYWRHFSDAERKSDREQLRQLERELARYSIDQIHKANRSE